MSVPDLLQPSVDPNLGSFFRPCTCDAPIRVVETLVAAAFTIPASELRAATRRSASVAFARQTAMYLARVALRMSYDDVGSAFGRDRTTAAYACRVVEERREDPGVDALLSRLESVCVPAVRCLERGERS